MCCCLGGAIRSYLGVWRQDGQADRPREPVSRAARRTRIGPFEGNGGQIRSLALNYFMAMSFCRLRTSLSDNVLTVWVLNGVVSGHSQTDRLWLEFLPTPFRSVRKYKNRLGAHTTSTLNGPSTIGQVK